MIRAGRLKYVQTMADLANALGKSLGTVRNTKPYAAAGHPEPISSPGSRAQLWDSEQTAAYYAGRPVPALPPAGDDEDLLDRQEAAELLGVSTSTWNSYKYDPALAEAVVVVPEGPKGTEHWPRRVVLAYKNSRPGRGTGGGRPEGSGDMVPRDQILPRIAELLDTDPAITLETVADTLGIAKFPTAQAGLAAVRGRRIADLVATQPGLDPKTAALQLGYPPITHRSALKAADQELRARSVKPYLRYVTDYLIAAGVAERAEAEVRRLDDNRLAAALLLTPGQPAPALVWDERFGWRTATNRRHPIGKHTDTAPEGEGIRYLGTSLRPEPEELLDALLDGRKGTKRPAATADGSAGGES
ncbi:hypothetical protein ACVW0K_007318 [Streptomyces filamentosus]